VDGQVVRAGPRRDARRRELLQGTGNVWNRRYGGDLAGLRQSLPYLRKLGITAIYLNPIFEAESMHKYDTSDFRHVDDNFGAKATTPSPPPPGPTTNSGRNRA
jgi:glycosidase